MILGSDSMCLSGEKNIHPRLWPHFGSHPLLSEGNVWLHHLARHFFFRLEYRAVGLILPMRSFVQLLTLSTAQACFALNSSSNEKNVGSCNLFLVGLWVAIILSPCHCYQTACTWWQTRKVFSKEIHLGGRSGRVFWKHAPWYKAPWYLSGNILSVKISMAYGAKCSFFLPPS